MAMRLELSQAGDAFLGANYQLYNVLVTSHAFLMIFFISGLLASLANSQIKSLDTKKRKNKI